MGVLVVEAYSAPKPRYPALVWLVYLYGAALCVGAVAALMGLGGFDFGPVAYTTPGLPVMTVVLAGLAIFALPFLVRLNLSILGRFFSAMFAVSVPFALLAYVLYLMGEGAIGFDWLVVAGCVLMAIAGVASFITLDGRRALSFSKK